MKKALAVIMALALTATLAVSLASCDNGKTDAEGTTAPVEQTQAA